MMIERKEEVETIRGLLQRHPVVGMIGARQVRKTTLARVLIRKSKGPSSYFDLENPEDLSRVADPMLALKDLKGLVVIDEIQRQPNLFPVLRVFVDRPEANTHFLVLGSASPDLLRQSAETLAGRIFYHELGGFSLKEVGIENHMRILSMGSTKYQAGYKGARKNHVISANIKYESLRKRRYKRPSCVSYESQNSR